VEIIKKAACRIYVIKSSASPVAAVFRRGPSKQVQVLKWDMETDVFTPGQWFKGRIYERRCDVSPDGQHLIYFAAKYKLPLYSWTAVSKLPYLTALALFPKGDGWGGGGLFKTNQQILLNHRPKEMSEAEGTNLPKGVKVSQFGDYSGRGEDNPICRVRLLREGWKVKQEGVFKLTSRRRRSTPYAETGPMFAICDPPEIMQKQRGASELEMTMLGYHEEDGPAYVIKFRLLGGDGQCLLDLGRADWADWSVEGDLLFARDGGIYRLGKAEWKIEKAVLLTDLNDARFEAVEAPDEYKIW
jgi:hypothetical protein